MQLNAHEYLLGAGIVILIPIVVLVWRLFSPYSPNPSQNTDNTSDTQRINKIVSLASFIMIVLIVIGELLELRPTSGPTTLMPAWENNLKPRKALKALILVGCFLLYIFIYVVPFWVKGNSKWRSHFRRGSNCALFVLAATGVFFWVAHTGGLTSLYGAAYLSLFSVAVIVPQRWIIKICISVPVALGAFLLAFMSQSVLAECYMCGLSILGSFLGVAIQFHLNRCDLNQAAQK